MSNHYNSAPTFTLFPNLPIEIRRMIWRLTLPGPRVVFVEPRKLKGGKCSRVWSDCENDEEGNEAFFDLEVSGEIDVRGRWSAYDFSGEKNRIQMREEEIYPNFEVLQDPAYEVATVVHKPGPQQLWGMKSTRLAPIVTLFICRESHQVAIDEKYTQAFGSIGCIPTIVSTPGSPPPPKFPFLKYARCTPYTPSIFPKALPCSYQIPGTS